MPDTHAENKELAMTLVTRNHAHIIDIDTPSCWMKDQKEADGKWKWHFR